MANIIDNSTEEVGKIIDGAGENSKKAVDAAQRAAGTVHDALPDLGAASLRKQIIDGAFEVTRKAVDASHSFAKTITTAAGDTLSGLAPDTAKKTKASKAGA